MKQLQTWLANHCESYLVELSLLYLTFFKTVLAALLRTISLNFFFLSSKHSFLDDHFTTENSDFSIFFLSGMSTDKPVNRSKHAYAVTRLKVLAFRGFFSFMIFSNKKKGRSLRRSGYTIQKICGGKMYLRTRTFKAESHKSNIRVTRWQNKYKMLNCIERHNFSE